MGLTQLIVDVRPLQRKYWKKRIENSGTGDASFCRRMKSRQGEWVGEKDNRKPVSWGLSGKTTSMRKKTCPDTDTFAEYETRDFLESRAAWRPHWGGVRMDQKEERRITISEKTEALRGGKCTAKNDFSPSVSFI